MIGAFIITAAGAEARTVAAVNALAGLRVSDPVIAPAAFRVEAFTGIAARCRRTCSRWRIPAARSAA